MPSAAVLIQAALNTGPAILAVVAAGGQVLAALHHASSPQPRKETNMSEAISTAQQDAPESSSAAAGPAPVIATPPAPAHAEDAAHRFLTAFSALLQTTAQITPAALTVSRASQHTADVVALAEAGASIFASLLAAKL
jgi:hypothetical protein